MCILITPCQRNVITSTRLTAIYVDLDHLAAGAVVRFLHCGVTLFSPFCTVLFGKEVTMCHSHVRSSELCSTSLKGIAFLTNLTISAF